MKTKKAIKILREMNKWRRRKPPYEGPLAEAPYTPEQFGKAVDHLIKEMEKVLN